MALRLKGSTSGSVELDVPAAVSGGDVTLTLPNGTGSANQFVKNGSAAGTLEYSSLIEDSSGKIGIGETSMDALLVIKGNSDGATTPSIRLKDGSDTREAWITNASGDLSLNVGGDDNVAHGTLKLFESGIFDYSQATGSKLRIDSSGNVGINDTSPGGRLDIGFNSSSVVGLVLSNAGTGTSARFYSGSSIVGSITVTGSATAFNTSSDYRLKENVVDIADGITRVKQLLPKRFNFIVDADTTVDGFLAHEAQTVVPEAVTGTHNEVDDDGEAVMQGIDQSKLVPLLTAALQEAIAKIETLEARVTTLEAS